LLQLYRLDGTVIEVRPDTASKSGRVRVLQAAYRVAERHGVCALTLDAVAVEAGVSKGGLLYHFPSKEALVEAMVDDLCEQFTAAVDLAADLDAEESGRPARAYLAASIGEPGSPSRWLALIGALGRYPRLLEAWRTFVLNGRAADRRSGVDPVATSIVRLAADGLWLAGILGLTETDDDLRNQVLTRLDEMTRCPR
jgi:AcrR family transcriptional regulator